MFKNKRWVGGKLFNATLTHPSVQQVRLIPQLRFSCFSIIQGEKDVAIMFESIRAPGLTYFLNQVWTGTWTD